MTTTTKVREQFQFESSAMMIENGGVMIEEGFEMTTVGVGGVTSGISPTAADDAMSSYFDPRFPKSISIVLLVVGVFGNSLCLFIFSRKHMRRNSTFVYLAFLACVDLFVLTLGLSDIILISYLNFVLRNQALFVCRFVSFLIYSFTHLSSFILASVSIDRAIATNFITYSKTYCRPLTAYKVIGFNIFLAVIINFHNLLFMGHISHTRIGDENGSIDYVNSNNRSNSVGNLYPLSSSTSSGGVAESGTMVVQVICESKKDTIYDAFIDPYYKWIDLLAYAIIPFIIMLICTFLIVRVLFRSNRRLNKNRTPAHSNKKSSQHQQQPKEEGVLILKKDQSANSGVNAAAISNSLLTISASNTQLNNNNSPTYNKDHNANSTTTTTNRNSGVVNIKSSANKPITPASAAASRASKAKHLTYTLIILNCLFFCLVGPLLIVLVTYSDQMIANNKILLNIVYLLAYANHTFNFVLYGFSSPPFRIELFRILRINQQPSNAATAAAAQQNPPINIKRV